MAIKTFRTDALEGLRTHEQLDLLNSIDTLRSQGISHYISLPQIIVCGDQSSGKSSVLEAISGVSFPVRSSLCTRFPTELVLRKSSEEGVRVSIVPHQSRSETEQQSLGSFSEHIESFEGLATLIENAKAAMGISTHGKAFSNDLLRVEVSGPDRPHLTIVDLPGLIHSETKQQSAADVQLVQEVVRSYMTEPRSIILAVISAKNDFANQIVLRLARETDPSGSRTLGVITKPDSLVAGSESEAQFASLAKNQEVEFRLGWHVLKNMDSEKGKWSLAERDMEELQFFSQGAWRDMPWTLVGINHLRARLSKLLLGQISAELPSLIDEIQARSEESCCRLDKLGKPRTTLNEQRSYLLHISQSFQSLVKAAVDGTYNELFFESVQTRNGYQKRIRAVVQNLNEEFAEHISRRGHYREIIMPGDERPVQKGQMVISRDEYTSYIGQLLKKNRGRELPGTFNPMIVRDLFLEQCGPWEELTYNHVRAVWKAVKEFLRLAVSHVADEATSTALFDEIIAPALDDQHEVLDRKTSELLMPHQRGHPITYNHYFTETLQKIRAERRESNFRGILERHFGIDNLEEPCFMENSFNLRELLSSLLQSTEPDMARFASAEAMDCMLSYYKVALKRFIDDIVTEVIEVQLIHATSDILSPVAVFGMPSHLVTRIAGESEENCALREQLDKKLHVLTKGLETCRRFVGIRTFETSDIRAQAQNELPASVSSQDTPKNIGEPQDDDVESGPAQTSPVEAQDDGFESVARPSPSSFAEEDKCVDPKLNTEFEATEEPGVAPTSTSTSRRRLKKGNRKPQSTTYAF